MTDALESEAVVNRIIDDWGSADVLFNHVGIAGPPGTALDVDLEQWNRCIDVNLTSMLVMSRFTIPHMIAAGTGSIVSMSSLAGLRGGHAGRRTRWPATTVEASGSTQ